MGNNLKKKRSIKRLYLSIIYYSQSLTICLGNYEQKPKNCIFVNLKIRTIISKEYTEQLYGVLTKISIWDSKVSIVCVLM